MFNSLYTLQSQRDVITERGFDGHDSIGEVVIDIADVFEGSLALLLGGFCRGLTQDLAAPDTGVLLAGRLLLAARTDQRPGRLGLVGLDIESVGAGDLPLVGIVEDGDVSGGDFRPSRPSVVFLEVGLTDALAGEIGGRGLAERRGRNVLGDARPVGHLFEGVPDAVVRDLPTTSKTTPQRVRCTTAWVVVEPSSDVRHRRDQDGRASPGLAVERQLQAVIVVGDVADLDAEELSRTRAGVPGKRDERPVSGVETGVEHRLDVVLPVQHRRRIRCGIVVARVAAGNPGDTVGQLVAVGDDLADRAERDTVVFVGLHTPRLLGVDPFHDVLGSLAIADGVRQTTLVLRDDQSTPEQKLVAVVGVLAGPQQSDLSVEIQEQLAVGLADVIVAVLEAVAHRRDGVGNVVGHTSTTDSGHVKVGCGTLPGHYSDSLHTQADKASESLAGSVRRQSISYNAIERFPAASPSEGCVADA